MIIGDASKAAASQASGGLLHLRQLSASRPLRVRSSFPGAGAPGEAGGRTESPIQRATDGGGDQKQEIRTWRKEHRWSPNRLRHTKATEIRKQFGLEAAPCRLVEAFELNCLDRPH
jgi:hypothetical protein